MSSNKESGFQLPGSDIFRIMQKNGTTIIQIWNPSQNQFKEANHITSPKQSKMMIDTYSTMTPW
jgi:hypothetical protein